MPMNLTLDDTSPQLQWEGDWRRQPANDERYFLSTYHGTQTKGATVSLSFTGSAVYIYGSHGPNHGNFNVQFDRLVQPVVGFTNNEDFQSLLFSRELDEGPHIIVVSNQEDFWLDIDFIVISVASSIETDKDPGSFPTTVTPATLPTGQSSTASNGQPSDTAPPTAPGTSSSLFLILTIVFASILAIILLSFVAFCWWRRRKDYADARELSFRYGHKGTPIPPPSFTQSAISGARGAGGMSTLGNALLGVVPQQQPKRPQMDQSSVAASSVAPSSLAASAKYQEKGAIPSAGNNEEVIALANFGQRPKFRAAGETSSYGRGRSDSAGSGTDRSESATATSPWTAAGWNEKDSMLQRRDGAQTPKTANSVTSDTSLSSRQQAHVAQSSISHSAIGSPFSGQYPGSASQSARGSPVLTSAGNFLPPRYPGHSQHGSVSDGTPGSPSTMGRQSPFIPASKHKNSESSSGGYGHLAWGSTSTASTVHPQGLRPPPRTPTDKDREKDRSRDKERERLDRLEREEAEKQDKLAAARGGTAPRGVRVPPPSSAPPRRPLPSAPADVWAKRAQADGAVGLGSRTGDIPIALGAPIMVDFDRDLELRSQLRAGSPANSSNRTYTPDVLGGGSQPAASYRSYTPDTIGSRRL